MASTRTSKTSREVADAGKTGVPSENPAETSVASGDAPSGSAGSSEASEAAETPSDVVDEAFADMEAKGEVIPAGAVRVRYNGRASVRGIGKSDFVRNSVTDQDDIEFNENNRWIVPMSPAAADYLVALGMGEFTRVPDEEMDMGEDAEPPTQKVPEFGVEPGTGGVALAVPLTPDAVK